jgi:L-ascorbate metabolism protein UlaG (beta-lactamase superfamily)
MHIQLIRSATVKISVGGVVLLVDPYLAPKGGGKTYAGRLTSPLVELPMPVDELLGDVDAVFVSHLHSDHFDIAAQRLLPKDLPLLCPAPIAQAIREMGFSDVTAIDNSVAWRGCSLTLTGGLHGPDEVLADMGDVHGFVLQADGEPTLLWVGDSIWCAPVREAVAAFEPAVVVVHACGADWNGKGPLVMDAVQVEQLLREAPRCTVIATHLDSVDHATVSRADLAQHMARWPELDQRLRIPADGQVLELAVDGRS